MKKVLVLFTAYLLLIIPSSYAYFENYPPFKLNSKKPASLEGQLIVDFSKNRYLSDDKRIKVERIQTKDNFSFLLAEDGLILDKIEGWKMPLPFKVYRLDFDKNGLKDYIVFSSYMGNGLAANNDRVDLYLKKEKGVFQKISYDIMASGLEDFVDLDNDNIPEIIIGDFYSGDKHNYFTYSIYKLNDYRLTNVDSQFDNFPKFIWFTNKPNDKNTTHLTNAEKQKDIKRKNESIKYTLIK